MKLYKVVCTIETVILANEEGHVYDYLALNIGNMVPDMTLESIEEIDTVEDLPKGWTPDCLPFGVSVNKTINQILEDCSQ